jgi:hypothetical protein
MSSSRNTRVLHAFPKLTIEVQVLVSKPDVGSNRFEPVEIQQQYSVTFDDC